MATPRLGHVLAQLSIPPDVPVPPEVATFNEDVERYHARAVIDADPMMIEDFATWFALQFDLLKTRILGHRRRAELLADKGPLAVAIRAAIATIRAEAIEAGEEPDPGPTPFGARQRSRAEPLTARQSKIRALSEAIPRICHGRFADQDAAKRGMELLDAAFSKLRVVSDL